MPLNYTRPEDGLARELEEVARDAIALQVLLQRGINSPLPINFPRNQILDICHSLTELPIGTAEGCRATLEYASNRLPAIRREHILSEGLETTLSDPDAPPPVIRRSNLDQLLLHLMGSSTTALDLYRHLSGEESKKDLRPEIRLHVADTITEAAIARSLRLEVELSTARETVHATTNPNSPGADNLKRQLQDGEGLNRLARAELRMPGVTTSWYSQLVAALKELPSIIRATAKSLKIGADIVEIGVNRWYEFQKNGTATLIEEFRKTCDALVAVSNKLEQLAHPLGDRSESPDFILSAPISYESILAYTNYKFPGLGISAEWNNSLLRDIDPRRYKTIRDIDREVEYAREEVQSYAKENPEAFNSETDWITKSLIFVDANFREVHSIAPETRKAALRARIAR